MPQKCANFAQWPIFYTLGATRYVSLLTTINDTMHKHNLESRSQPAAKLQSALIIGDSISIGYTPMVKQRLKDVAHVHRPNENCRDTKIGLKHLDEWLGKTQWDVIHFNWGLHDLCYRHPDADNVGHRDKINGVISVPLDDYTLHLENLVQQLLTTGAVLIWANTTTVPTGEVGRISGDEVRYNRAAKRIMDRYEITTNDLHTLTSTLDHSFFIGAGDVHYTNAGYNIIAAQVAEKIRHRLAQRSLHEHR